MRAEAVKEQFDQARDRLFPTQSISSLHHASAFNHFVQFYENDAFLAKLLGVFIGSALGGGEKAVIIATKTHRDAFERRLRRHGVNLSTVKSQGRYLALDAGEMLEKIMRNGLPDAELFNRAIGSLVADFCREKAPVRGFDEMAVLLWADGKTDAALRLEELWNNLGKIYSFSLFCAYPMDCFPPDTDLAQLGCICLEHHRVIPPESYFVMLGTEAFPAEPPVAEADDEEFSGQGWENNSDAHLAAIVESAEDAIVGKNLLGIITSWNPSAGRLFGYSASEAIGQSVRMLIPADRQSEEKQILARISRGERIEHYETVRRRKDGSTFEVSLTISPVRDADGKVIGATKIVRDMTARKRLEKALQLTREQLARVGG